MTYEELLKETAARKRGVLVGIDAALKGPAGFLAEAKIRKDPGKAAWILLAKEFCEKLAEHIDEFMDEDESAAQEAMEIYMAYEDGDEGLYGLLPTEARLFDPIE